MQRLVGLLLTLPLAAQGGRDQPSLLLRHGSEQRSSNRQLGQTGQVLVTRRSGPHFTAGPSHVRPTGRSGRFFSGLRVADFMRRTSLVRYDRASLRRATPVVAAFAALEQLGAHGRSVEIRVE